MAGIFHQRLKLFKLLLGWLWLAGFVCCVVPLALAGFEERFEFFGQGDFVIADAVDSSLCRFPSCGYAAVQVAVCELFAVVCCRLSCVGHDGFRRSFRESVADRGCEGFANELRQWVGRF